MQDYCISRYVVAKFRSEAIYTEFMKQWNWKLGEFQEIAGSLDSVLTTSSLVPVQNLDPNEVNYQDLTLKSSVTLLERRKWLCSNLLAGQIFVFNNNLES
ncbi:oligomeric component, putative [Medicago truncatula]|uniref:Oligomeric component, putative n=1 Tax=Medicago truncatula TaxID=3880 RepID=A0A072VN22_MEDTR|nr:oligomeric component, putative [Medicago truncatula]